MDDSSSPTGAKSVAKTMRTIWPLELGFGREPKAAMNHFCICSYLIVAAMAGLRDGEVNANSAAQSVCLEHDDYGRNVLVYQHAFPELFPI